jgi:proline dehydrogenase
MGLTRRALLWAGDRKHAQRLISRAPLARRVAARFVAGETAADAIAAIKQLNTSGLGGILDLLGEGVTEPAEAEAAAGAYADAVAAAAQARVSATASLKLTQLGLLLDRRGCAARLGRIGRQGVEAGVGIEVDMEQSEYVDATIETYLASGLEPLPRLAIQAYLHRTPDDLSALLTAGARIRLVKGAYLEPADCAIQQADAIDRRYCELATLLLEKGRDPAFATHDTAIIDHVVRHAERIGLGRDAFEFQMLYGIRRDLQMRLARRGFCVRVYVPFGSAWYPYLVRRLAERPANLRFFARSLVGR